MSWVQPASATSPWLHHEAQLLSLLATAASLQRPKASTSQEEAPWGLTPLWAWKDGSLLQSLKGHGQVLCLLSSAGLPYPICEALASSAVSRIRAVSHPYAVLHDVLYMRRGCCQASSQCPYFPWQPWLVRWSHHLGSHTAVPCPGGALRRQQYPSRVILSASGALRVHGGVREQGLGGLKGPGWCLAFLRGKGTVQLPSV